MSLFLPRFLQVLQRSQEKDLPVQARSTTSLPFFAERVWPCSEQKNPVRGGQIALLTSVGIVCVTCEWGLFYAKVASGGQIFCSLPPQHRISHSTFFPSLLSRIILVLP